MDGIKNLKINTDMFNNPNLSFKLSRETIGTKVVEEDKDLKENKEENEDLRRKK